MAKRNFSKFQSLYNNNKLKQFYTIPYGTKSVQYYTSCSFLLFKVTSSSSNLFLISDLKFTSSEL